MIPDRVFVTGTDTDVGKTVVCAALCAAFGHAYWKPIQAGLGGPTDTERVAELSGARTLPEAWRLSTPASPHRAAPADGVRVDLATLTLPDVPRLIVEGAGGWCVPIADDPIVWQATLVARLHLPVLVVARTALGTLHHTTSTVRAARADGADVVGLVLVGEPHPHNEADLPRLTGVPVLARLPHVELPSGFERLVGALRPSPSSA